MTRNTLKYSFVLAGFSCLIAAGQVRPKKDPRLVLLIAVDQFRYDYLTRFRDEYKGGLDRLLRNGANFVNANLDHYPTVTAVGHSTMLSGATPQTSGIIANEWYDREAGKTVTSVSDDSVRLLGGQDVAGESPRRLLVSTLGDEMKRGMRDHPKVIGISLKDRASVLPSGHMADAAYWYDTKTGTFVSSTYYFPKLPDWAEAFNQRRLVDKYAGSEWRFDSGPAGLFKMPAAAGPELANAMYNTPFGSELLEQFVEEAIRQEKLGQRDATDLLTVSFSPNDPIGHTYGPDSPRAHDISLRTDRLLAKLFAYLEQTIGMQHVLIVLTADHGVSPLPEELQKEKMPGGRVITASLNTRMQNALVARFGPGQWLVNAAGVYLNLALIAEKKLDRAEVERVAAQAIADAPHVARVYTRQQLLLGEVSRDKFSDKIVRSYNARRSGDLEVVLEPYWIRGATGASHGAPFNYDSHIPLIFMGPGVRPGRYARSVVLNDLAPSLATMLNVETPSGSVGQALFEMMTGVADGAVSRPPAAATPRR
ncbi:MAG: type phosphodiesterase/nucleotide pyrophosphatase [Candidatus Solibacter sp.]|nr:type phosphodiesterase/nucleotide pyrophosphatase [Candidatus Solibacter sp.]